MSSDGSPYEKRVDAKGRVLSEKCIADEIPFEKLPEGWAWARLETLALILNGDRGKNYPAKSKLHKSGIPFVSAINIERGVVTESNMLYLNESQYEALRAGQLQKGDSVFCIRGSLGKHGVFPFDKGAIASSLVVVRLISSEVLHETYLELLFDSPLTFIGIRRFNNGTAQPNLAARDFGSFLYALPPLTEQRRIVERVEELMPLVEEYGELEDDREALDAALPERLRKSVLQMAVQGKLVPQDPSDEPASELLKRIRGQRRELVAEKKMKAPKGGESVIFRGSDGRRYEKRIDSKGRESDPTCIEDEIPFEIPDSWEWARLGSLCNFGKCQNIEYGCVAVGTWNLDLEDIEKETGTILRKKLKAAGENGSTKHIFDAGMVLYSKLRPYLNKVVVADEGGVCSSEILPLDFGQLNAEYAQLALMEPGFVEYAKGCAYGVKMPRLGTEDGKQWLVAIPPLPEQHRIVAAFKIFTMNAF